ncbi:MAG: hypothetical protein [Avonheates virus SG2_28]|nr:MAG: hypothetical protein [Avonheates virus SG2_28]
MQPDVITSMTMITREIIFCNGKAYSLTDTMNKIFEFSELAPAVCPQDVYQQVVDKLMALRCATFVDLDDFILDPMTHGFVGLEMFFFDWGVQEQLHDLTDDAFTIDTFDITTIDSTLDGEECMEDDEEDILVETVGVLLQMRDPQFNLLHEIAEMDQDDISTLAEEDTMRIFRD